MENKKEPLMSPLSWYEAANKICVSPYSFAKEYAKYHTQWHLNNAKEFVADEAVVFIPSHSHLHGAKLVDKQSIHTAIDNYIEINLKK